MTLPNPVRINPVRLFAAALSLMCLPLLAQNVVVKPAPTATTTPAAMPEPTPTPAPAPEIAPTSAPTVTPAPAATVTPAPTDTKAEATPSSGNHAQMEKMQTTMTENMAKNEAADTAMKAHMDSEQAGMKSDMEMKHAIIAQLQAMSDQIAQLNDRVTALTAQLDTPVKPVKPVKAKPAVRPPIKPVF